MTKYILTWVDGHDLYQEIFDTSVELEEFVKDSCVGRDRLAYFVNEVYAADEYVGVIIETEEHK